MAITALTLTTAATPILVETTTGGYKNQFAVESGYETENLNLSLPREITLQRGFQIINGNIHDRYGNLQMELDENGFNADGFGISPTFSITYFSDLVEKYGDSLFYDSYAYDYIESRSVINIFHGSVNAPLNTTGC